MSKELKYIGEDLQDPSDPAPDPGHPAYGEQVIATSETESDIITIDRLLAAVELGGRPTSDTPPRITPDAIDTATTTNIHPITDSKTAENTGFVHPVDNPKEEEKKGAVNQSMVFPLGSSELFPRGFSSAVPVLCCGKIFATTLKTKASRIPNVRAAQRDTKAIDTFIRAINFLSAHKAVIPIYRDVARIMAQTEYIFEVDKYTYLPATMTLASNKRYFVRSNGGGFIYWEILLDTGRKFENVSEAMLKEIRCCNITRCKDVVDMGAVTQWVVVHPSATSAQPPLSSLPTIPPDRDLFCCSAIRPVRSEYFFTSDPIINEVRAFVDEIIHIGPGFEAEWLSVSNKRMLVLEVEHEPRLRDQEKYRTRYFVRWFSQFCEVELDSESALPTLTKVASVELFCDEQAHSEIGAVRINALSSDANTGENSEEVEEDRNIPFMILPACN